ncbi:hypothetical protein BH24GEM1_BH24GEM1_05550 [soil metagenome]
MSSNALFFGWNRPLAGRERMSAQHFQEFNQYLGGLQQRGEIDSYDTVFLNNHGGDLNGFFLIRADNSKLDTVMASSDWVTHMIRAAMHLDGVGAIRGVTGQLVMERMEAWSRLIPA